MTGHSNAQRSADSRDAATLSCAGRARPRAPAHTRARTPLAPPGREPVAADRRRGTRTARRAHTVAARRPGRPGARGRSPPADAATQVGDDGCPPFTAGLELGGAVRAAARS